MTRILTLDDTDFFWNTDDADDADFAWKFGDEFLNLSNHFTQKTLFNQMKHEEITDRIIRIFYEVYNELGYGFLEKVYQNAFFIALKQEGLNVVTQQKIRVCFRGLVVGEFVADLVVESKIIVEIKAAEFIAQAHEFQLVNYLKCSEIEVGLLLNFGKKPEIRRKVFSH